MGHGDEIVIADGNFPAQSMGNRVVRADGLGGKEMLSAILQLLPLDGYGENFILMQVSEANGEKPTIWNEYEKIASCDRNVKIAYFERYAFYERSKRAYAIIATGESALYANIILKKGTI